MFTSGKYSLDNNTTIFEINGLNFDRIRITILNNSQGTNFWLLSCSQTEGENSHYGSYLKFCPFEFIAFSLFPRLVLVLTEDRSELRPKTSGTSNEFILLSATIPHCWRSTPERAPTHPPAPGTPADVKVLTVSGIDPFSRATPAPLAILRCLVTGTLSVSCIDLTWQTRAHWTLWHVLCHSCPMSRRCWKGDIEICAESPFMSWPSGMPRGALSHRVRKKKSVMSVEMSSRGQATCPYAAGL